MLGDLARSVVLTFIVQLTAIASPAQPLTLEQAIAAALENNASLPVAALEVRIAEQRRLEAEAARRVRLAVEGDLIYAPPGAYDPVVTNLGEDRLQLAGDKTLYAGGAFAAGIRRATALHGAAAAGYRQAVRDVEYGVRTTFAELIAADREIAARREAIERLQRYRSLLESRHRAGQDVAAALSRTTVQAASTRADLILAEARRDAAGAALNTLMGRPLDAAVEPAPLPPPAAPDAVASVADATSPDVEAARLEAEAAAAAVGIARSEPRPHLELHADAGLLGSDTADAVPPDFAANHPGATFGDRIRRDLGYSVGLFVTWPLTDFGAIRARIAQAELAARQAAQNEQVMRRQVSLEQAQARSAMEHAFRRFSELHEALPEAHDAALEAESRYFGGAGSYLEVLDAFAAATDVAVRAAEADLAYRQAEALALRWEGRP